MRRPGVDEIPATDNDRFPPEFPPHLVTRMESSQRTRLAHKRTHAVRCSTPAVSAGNRQLTRPPAECYMFVMVLGCEGEGTHAELDADPFSRGELGGADEVDDALEVLGWHLDPAPDDQLSGNRGHVLRF